MMAARIFIVFVAAAFLAIPVPAESQSQDDIAAQVLQLPWEKSPSVGAIGSIARMGLAPGLMFLDSSSTSRFLQLNGNPPRDNEYAVAPQDFAWFAVFSYDDSGYVKDDEKLDPDALLTTLQRQNEAGIAERRQLGLPILHLQGWAVVPHYDKTTHRLEWGTRLTGDDGGVTVNYTIRLLGRSGVMSAVLVSDPGTLEQNVTNFKKSLTGYSFVPGQTYSEFRQGDRVAAFGLGALIAGGAAAAAAKAGGAAAIKGFAKVIGLGIMALFATVAGGIKTAFNRFTGRK